MYQRLWILDLRQYPKACGLLGSNVMLWILDDLR